MVEGSPGNSPHSVLRVTYTLGHLFILASVERNKPTRAFRSASRQLLATRSNVSLYEQACFCSKVAVFREAAIYYLQCTFLFSKSSD